ncbi:MAG TPA: DUF3105 domain-containing protein [Jatrophihabitantaceae bacterium]|nr:DUF3105 domain-containing protein [Jatrophihabitantaceae bacterium]
MAQRKSPPPSARKGSTASRPGARPGGRTTTASTRATAQPPGRPPAKKKPGKSIVNQRQTPWSLIITTIVIVLFAGSIVTYVIVNKKTETKPNAGCSAMIGNNQQSFLNELKCAKDINGVTFKPEANRSHITSGTVQYDTTPPTGGNHSPYWADCAGTVYSQPIANENAVHMLEHGAIWITYKEGLATDQVVELSKLVNGVDHMAMSPYPDLDSPISLQAWGYQLKVDSASDPRIKTFITDLRQNKETTPEFGGICSQPTFKAHPSTFGHPLFKPAT